MCVCVCVCVIETKTKKKRVYVDVRVCVRRRESECAYVFDSVCGGGGGERESFCVRVLVRSYISLQIYIDVYSRADRIF